VKITESTTVSVTLVIAIVGGVTWLSTIYATELEHGKKIQRVEEKLEKRDDDDSSFRKEVIDRLARIEERLSHGK
jgi:hypothetical protein